MKRLSAYERIFSFERSTAMFCKNLRMIPRLHFLRRIPGGNVAALAVLLVEAALPVHSAQAGEPQGLLETIHRHTTCTSTVTDNGDLNPYAIIVAPVSA